MIYQKFKERSDKVELKIINLNGIFYADYQSYFQEIKDIDNDFRDALAKKYCWCWHIKEGTNEIYNKELTDKIYEKSCYLSGANGDFEKSEELYIELTKFLGDVLVILKNKQ